MARRAQARRKLIARLTGTTRRYTNAAAIFAAALCAFPIRAQVVIGLTSRSITVGDSTVSERVALARYQLVTDRVRFRIDGSALRFRAPADSISGNLPFSATLDFARRPGDTLTAFVRSASAPLDLSARQTSALGIVGTSAVDLESTGLGTPAMGGGRLVLSFPVGALVAVARAGAEYEPRPGGTQPVYWRGATVRGGVAVIAASGDDSFTGSLDVSRSSADSLGGRNLFPGGGTVSLQLQSDLSVASPFDLLEDERWPVRVLAFYSRPFASGRADQPNRIIPQGDLLGAIGTMLVPVRHVTVAPSLQLLRESSSSTSGTGLVRTVLSGTAWTMQLGLDVAIPLGGVFELTPQAGYTFGRVGASFAETAAIRRGRGLVRTTAFSDSIRGRWFGIQLSASL